MQQDSAARQQQEQQQVPMQAPTTPPLGGPAAPHTQFAAAPSFSASSVTAAAINAQHMASTSQQGVSGQEPSARASARPPDDSLEMVGGVPVIPVSAAQAGLLPERKGEVVLASELLFDAVQEERVAHQAQAFFQANTHARMPPET